MPDETEPSALVHAPDPMAALSPAERAELRELAKRLLGFLRRCEAANPEQIKRSPMAVKPSKEMAERMMRLAKRKGWKY